MFSHLFLKSKTDDCVVYYYGMDSPDSVSDGEVAFYMENRERRVLKSATGDDDGSHARWLVFPHLRRIVVDEGSPKEYFLAIG